MSFERRRSESRKCVEFVQLYCQHNTSKLLSLSPTTWEKNLKKGNIHNINSSV